MKMEEDGDVLMSDVGKVYRSFIPTFDFYCYEVYLKLENNGRLAIKNKYGQYLFASDKYNPCV